MKKNRNHILVIDDDDRIRELVKEYLNEKGFIVSTGDNAEQAKIKLKYFRFDLIVLDVMMPGQSGFDLTKEIRKTSEIPIILLTAKGEVENRIAGLEIGADDYLGKPFLHILGNHKQFNPEKFNEEKIERVSKLWSN